MPPRGTAWLCVLLLIGSTLVEGAKKKPWKPKPWKPFDTATRCKDGVYPCLIFEDTFEKLDFKTWQHEITAAGGGNWEFQYYTNNRSNSYVKDGILYMKPTLAEDRWGKDWAYKGHLEIWGTEPANLCTSAAWWGCDRMAAGSVVVNPIQSSRLRTVNTFAFRYGRFEVEAKLPRGDWIWPAIWLLPKRQATGNWPASGEIDIMESRGNKDIRDEKGEQIGLSQMGSTMHYGPYWGENGWEKAHGVYNLQGRHFGDDFHRFRLDWDENGLSFFCDDELVAQVDTEDGYWKRGGFDGRLPDDRNVWIDRNPDTPFDEEFYIILNVAVGGTGGFFKDEWSYPAYPKPWKDKSETAFRDFWQAKNQWWPTWPQGEEEDDRAMQINYIRVWKLKEDCWIDGSCKK